MIEFFAGAGVAIAGLLTGMYAVRRTAQGTHEKPVQPPKPSPAPSPLAPWEMPENAPMPDVIDQAQLDRDEEIKQSIYRADYGLTPLQYHGIHGSDNEYDDIL